MFDGGLAIPFSTLNCPIRKLGFANPYRTCYRVRPIRVSAIPPSSVDNLPELKKGPGSNSSSANGEQDGSLLSQSNTIGIIGGVSADSTLNFVKKLVNLSPKGGKFDLPFILCSDPVLNKELLTHERSSFRSITGKTESVKIDSEMVVENLRRKRMFLENSGARCIVMPCHVSHSWHNEVAEGCSVSFLHMAECVAKELKNAKLKPLEAGSPLRIGVLASNAILDSGFYQEKLQNEGFEVVLPDKETMEHTIVPAIEASDRNDMEGARNLLRIALQVLLVRAVNTVILASEDMRDLLPQDDPLLKKCVDPTDALARSTVKWAKSAAERHPEKKT